MPIRPIDLQTLLMQLNQVGREQAAEKEGAALQASMQGAAAQRRQVDSKEAIRAPSEPKDGAGPVAERQGAGQGGSEKRRGEEGEGGEAKPEDEIVRDPELGNKIDLSG